MQWISVLVLLGYTLVPAVAWGAVIQTVAVAETVVCSDSGLCYIYDAGDVVGAGVAGDTFLNKVLFSDQIQLYDDVSINVRGGIGKEPSSLVPVDFSVRIALTNQRGDPISEMIDVYSTTCTSIACGFGGFPAGVIPEFGGLLAGGFYFEFTTSASTPIPIRVSTSRQLRSTSGAQGRSSYRSPTR